FLSTDRHARIARKGLQQLPFGRRQANEYLAPTQFPPLQFEGELAEENPLCIGLRRSLGRAAEDRLNAQDQFARLEGFGQVIVGTTLETLDPVIHLIHRGQEQDRYLTLLTEPARELKPVF